MKNVPILLTAAIVATATFGASAAYQFSTTATTPIAAASFTRSADECTPWNLLTAMKADEGVPHNLVTAMKADEGVPHNLVIALKADEGVPHNLVTALKADEGVPHNLVAAMSADEGTSVQPARGLDGRRRRAAQPRHRVTRRLPDLVSDPAAAGAVTIAGGPRGGSSFSLRAPPFQRHCRHPDLLCHIIQSRTLRRQQPRHRSVLEHLSASRHLALSTSPEGLRSYPGGNYCDAGGNLEGDRLQSETLGGTDDVRRQRRRWQTHGQPLQLAWYSEAARTESADLLDIRTDPHRRH